MAQPLGSPEGSDTSRRAAHTLAYAAVNAPVPVTHGSAPTTLLSAKKQKTDTGHAVRVLHRSGRVDTLLTCLY